MLPGRLHRAAPTAVRSFSFLHSNPADIGHLRRVAAEIGLRNVRAREGITLSQANAPDAWDVYAARVGSVWEHPLVSYRPQEGTPRMMVVDVGSSMTPETPDPATQPVSPSVLHAGSLVRTTDAVSRIRPFGDSKAVRACTIGVVESVRRDSAIVTFTGYFEHPLGLPMVMERTDWVAWQEMRQMHGGVRRALPSGSLEGHEIGIHLRRLVQGDEPVASRHGSSSSVPVPRDLFTAPAGPPVPTLEVPLSLLEVSDGQHWRPMCNETASRRQALAPIHLPGLAALRQISAGRLNGTRQLTGWGPGVDTSMLMDARVIAFAGSGVGRDFNLVYIDEGAEYVVVAMGSASGSLYSAPGSLSFRTLPLADTYIPFAQLLQPSLPLANTLHTLTPVICAMVGAPEGSSPYFRYHGEPLKPAAETGLFHDLWSIFSNGGGAGPGEGLDEQTSCAKAYQHLLAEHVASSAGHRVGVWEPGGVALDPQHFCMVIDGHEVVVWLDDLASE